MRTRIFLLSVAWCLASTASAQTEVMAWGNLTGVRIDVLHTPAEHAAFIKGLGVEDKTVTVVGC